MTRINKLFNMDQRFRNKAATNQMGNEMESKDVTIRANGKAHPAIELFDANGRSTGFIPCCNCPGSKNGSLANSAKKIAEGHEKSNCRI